MRGTEPVQSMRNGHWVFYGAARQFWDWAPFLPLPADLVPVSLDEGGTPLVRSRAFAGHQIYFKDETRNPTGSHKDRPLALAAADARRKGARVMAVVSAGSTGLSNAAYAAQAGLRSVAIMAPGAPDERVAPLAMLGSRLIEVDGDIDQAIAALTQVGGRHGIYVASTTESANPVQAYAGRTIAFEIVARLGRAPDMIVVPVGGGGTMAAMHAGFRQLRDTGAIARLPRLVAVVPDRYDLLSVAFRQGVTEAVDFFAMAPPQGGQTILNKIAHLHPPDGVQALAALRDSDGRVMSFSDEQARRAVPTIGATEGLYLEPSSAIVLPALERLIDENAISPGDTVVVLACGSGFRETSTIVGGEPPARETIGLRDLEAVLAASGQSDGSVR